MLPNGSVTGRPAPIAAAIGSSIRKTRRAPALLAASRIARRSTVVEPEGTQIAISGLPRVRTPALVLALAILIGGPRPLFELAIG
jgi:hypothetical protein